MTDERMAEHSPHEEPYRRPTWDEVRREQIEWAEEWRERQARWAVRSARTRALIDMLKRQEELAARRRCWLF